MAEYLTISEAARITGWPAKTLRRWANDGNLPVRKTPGGTRMFRREDLNALPKKATQEPLATASTVSDT
jgi:excisionase family DNA binding protein